MNVAQKEAQVRRVVAAMLEQHGVALDIVVLNPYDVDVDDDSEDDDET